MDHHINQTPQEMPIFHPGTHLIPEETDSQGFNLPGELDHPMAYPTFEVQQDQLSHLEPPPSCYPPQLHKVPLKSWLSKRHFSPSTGKTPRGEKEAVAELLSILVDTMKEVNTRSKESLLKKFFSEIERDDRLEKVIVERLRESKVKVITDLCQQLPSSVREQISGSGEENSGLVEEDPKLCASNDGGWFPSFDANTGYSGSMEVFGTSSTCQRSLMETVDDLSQELERFKVKTLAVGGIGQDVQEEGIK